MQEYIKKLEDENKKLVDELGRTEALISSTPFNSDLYITFGTDFEFDGTLCAFLARLSYAYVNPHTGSEEDKHLKRYEEKVTSNPKENNLHMRKVLYRINDDLRDFFNIGIQSFKTDVHNKDNPSDGIPWKFIEPWEISFLGMMNDDMVSELFEKQKVIAMRHFKRITRWTRFKQMMKGI